MPHQRKLIRDAIVARLVADIPSLADKIYPNRIRPLFQSKLPCILVYTLKEPSEVSTESPREFKRDLQVVIEIAAKADDSLDDTLDALCLQVESSIFKEETFGGLVTDTYLQDTEVTIMKEGEKLIGTAQITLLTPYYSRLPEQPSSSLDAFLNAYSVFDTTSDGVAEAVDNISLDQ